MRVLAFDTTGNGLAVAILQGQTILASQIISLSNIQAELLIPTIEQCLNQAQLWYNDLDLIATTSGPGSFTSIRVGFASAKALKLATKLPLISFNSLEIIAYDYKNCAAKILVIMDAKLDEVFIQEFSSDNGLLTPAYPPRLISYNEIDQFLPQENFYLAGNAHHLVTNNNQIINHDAREDRVKATNLGLMAQEIYQQSLSTYVSNDSQALYIRKPRISERKK
jgi:tRNA threonylcarbamoyladenosine biosynthesis protein TsaB